jgi:hypothetical protein
MDKINCGAVCEGSGRGSGGRLEGGDLECRVWLTGSLSLLPLRCLEYISRVVM